MCDPKSSNSQDTLPIPPKPKLVTSPRKKIGVDVSHHNGVLDWSKLKAAGVEFAIMKATEGNDFRDGQFIRNVTEAHKLGIETGAYHFFRPRSDGHDQAMHFLKTLAGLPITLPPVLDWEVHDDKSVEIQSIRARDWLETVGEKMACKPVIYTYPSFVNDKLKNLSWLNQYPLWIAHYTNAASPKVPKPWTSYWAWQFTEAGTFPEYPNKKFDVNIMGTE